MLGTSSCWVRVPVTRLTRSETSHQRLAPPPPFSRGHLSVPSHGGAADTPRKMHIRSAGPPRTRRRCAVTDARPTQLLPPPGSAALGSPSTPSSRHSSSFFLSLLPHPPRGSHVLQGWGHLASLDFDGLWSLDAAAKAQRPGCVSSCSPQRYAPWLHSQVLCCIQMLEPRWLPDARTPAQLSPQPAPLPPVLP